MKILVNTPILDIDGTELKDGDKTMILADVLLKALLLTVKEDETSGEEQKLKLWNLAQAVQAARGTTLDLTINEAALIKSRVCKLFPGALIIGNVHKIFETEGSAASAEK